jgi:hypothetical protein
MMTADSNDPDSIAERAKKMAELPENAAARDHHQRVGVDNDRPAQNPETDPAATDHPTGEDQARQNAENEPPG